MAYEEPVPPAKGPEPQAIDQAYLVVENSAEEPGEATDDARTGGRIYTCMHEEDETRRPELHGAVAYQKETADPGEAPSFIGYTELTKARGTVRE